jgi:hypothetical protein
MKSHEIAAELGVADGDVLYERLQGLDADVTIPAVGIDIDFMALSELHGHHGFDMALKVIAQRLVAAVHTDDLVAMHGWDFAVIAERFGDDSDALAAYAGELEHALSAEPIEAGGESFVFTPTVRSGMVNSTWDLRLIFLSPAEEKARHEERRRARLEAEGPSKVDDVMDEKFMQYSAEHLEGIEADTIYPPEWSPILRMQLAAQEPVRAAVAVFWRHSRTLAHPTDALPGATISGRAGR